MYVGIVPEQVKYAKKFFTKHTHTSYIGLGVGPEYRQLGGFVREYHGGIYIGRLDERQKRVGFLIHGIGRVIQVHPELRGKELLRIVGDGPDLGRYRRLSRNLGLEKNVSFIGTATGESVVRSYNDSGFYASASEWESPGRAFIEAMACGIPLLLNYRNNAAITEDMGRKMVEEGRNGMIYRYGDIEDFSKKFYSMYSNIAGTERMGNNAANFARRHFNLDRQNKHYADDIRKILGEWAP